MSRKVEFKLPNAEEVESLRKILGTSEQDIKEAVAVLRSWLQQQPHLPNVIDDRRLEGMYINCKCSLERTKRTLDAYYSLKTTLPELLMNRVPEAASIKQSMRHLKHAIMPRLTPEGCRVHVALDCFPDPETMDLLGVFRVGFMYLELLLAEDYSLGDVIVLDFGQATLQHLLRIDVNMLRNIDTCYKTVYNRRLKGLHFINAPKIMDMILKVVKSGLSEKLQKRISVHLPGSNSIFEHVPREFLPNEVGGTAGPMEDFRGEYNGLRTTVTTLKNGYLLADRTVEYRDWFLKQDQFVSDETKRPNKAHSPNDIFGIEGSFKKISID